MKKTQIAPIIRSLLFALGLCSLLSCGKNLFSSSTDVGQSVIDDFNPGITDVNGNIKTFSGSAVVQSAYSMRDAGDSVLPWLHREMTALAVGTFGGVQMGGKVFYDISCGYVEFRPGVLRQSGHETDRNNLKSAYSIDSVVLTVNRFRLNIGSSPAGKTADVAVFACDTSKDTAAFSFSNAKIPASSIAQGFLKVGLDSSAADTVYSIKLDTSYITRIKRAVGDSAVFPEDTGWFALFMKPVQATSEVVRFDNLSDVPRIKVYYRPDSADTAISSVTLNRHHASYAVFEQDSSAACGYPFSSWASGRRAVLKLGVSSLRDYMDTAAGDDKKYVVIQRADLKLRLSGLVSDLQVDSVLVLYCISSEPLTTLHDFSLVSTFYARPGVTDTTYSLPAASWLQKTVVKQKSDTVYLYLTVPAQTHSYSPPSIQIDWTQPQDRLDLKAVVTNPRTE